MSLNLYVLRVRFSSLGFWALGSSVHWLWWAKNITQVNYASGICYWATAYRQPHGKFNVVLIVYSCVCKANASVSDMGLGSLKYVKMFKSIFLLKNEISFLYVLSIRQCTTALTVKNMILGGLLHTLKYCILKTLVLLSIQCAFFFLRQDLPVAPAGGLELK